MEDTRENIEKELQEKLVKNPHPEGSFERYSYDSDCRGAALNKLVLLEKWEDEIDKKFYNKIRICIISAAILITTIVVALLISALNN